MPNDNYTQHPEHIARARGYHVAALAMFDKGFTAETHRKDALDYLNRAYDVLVKEALNYALWSRRTRAADDSQWLWDDEADHQFYVKNNAPDLCNWKPKHIELWGKYATPATIKIANVLKADRDAIKAAPLQKKAPSKTARQEQARLAQAKTCQICSRPIMAETGKIAHHGYQRPGIGYQTQSCYGALHLPFEESRDRLGQYIQTILKPQLENMKTTLAGVESESYAIRIWYGTGQYNGRHEIRKSFPARREGYEEQRDAHRKQAAYRPSIPDTFDQAKAREVHVLKRDIEMAEAYLVGQQVRYNGWALKQENAA